MKNSLALVVGGMILMTALVVAGSDAAKTNRVSISYVPPTNPAHQQVYELLKERQSLEKFQELFSPFRLQYPLHISLTGCDGEADAMYSYASIRICYEYIEELRTYVPAETTPAGIEPLDTVLGPFVDTILHEFAHALFDNIGIPILGREEDAADQVGAYIYLQLGDDEAHRLIIATVYAYMLEVEDTDPPTMEEYADEASTPEQRAFNLSCMAYGKDPELFEDVIALVGMPQERIDICEEEYELFTLAYEKLISPHVDPELAQKVSEKSWLPEATSPMLSE
jgi:hypothetical protein